MGNVAVFTIGCKVNQAESEELKAVLAQDGHFIVSEPSTADLCVVNTCTVTAESDRKCRKLVRRLGKRGARAIVIAGCYAEVNPGEAASLPGVVRVLPNEHKDDWHREIKSLLPAATCGDPQVFAGRTRAFIKVQDGCERACSYCIVPSARGRERSRAVREVLEETERYLSVGAREIVLCGINLARYFQGQGWDLDRLVREVLSAGEGFRVRLSSLELEDLRMEWLEEWAADDRVCAHLHLPLQSGDDTILQDMGRGYRCEDFVTAAYKLRAVWPGAALTTEVIVGYPGESEEAFGHTLDAMEEARPARIHVFRFSKRPGTRAGDRTDEVSPRVMEERSQMMRALAEDLRIRYIEERRGERRALLVERLVGENGSETGLGTTEDYIKGMVYDLPAGTAAGDIIAVEICGTHGGRAHMMVAAGER